MLRHWHGRWRFAMLDDEELGAKLAKVQALVGCPGERATAAMDRPPATGALRARKGLETAARSRWPSATDQGNDDDALAEPHEERGAMRARAGWLAAALALSLLAAGCGGKGGGSAMPPPSGSDPTPVDQPPPPGPRVPPPAATPADLRALAVPYSDDTEYGTAWGLAQIGAATAYARIARRDGAGTAPGAGARVGVIDTGIDAGHWEFDSERISNTNAHTNTGRSHGTAVASIIAARRDGPVPAEFSQDDFHGVAWGVDLLQMTAVKLDSADPSLNYEGIDAAELETDAKRLTEWASEATSVDFVNMSFGVHGLVENYLDKEGFGPDYAQAVRTLEQAGGRVLVFAAGNDYEHPCESPEPGCVGGRLRASSPNLFAGLPVLETSLRGHVVAVVATDREGRIAHFSHRCGIAAKWCIAAPGELVPVAVSVPDPDNPGQRVRFYDPGASGTSYAAPHVTGGLAVLKHWFRSQMANEALLARLYATARVTPDAVPAGGACPAHLDLDGDRSACELSSVFGRGVMDLGAATAPVGRTSIALGDRVASGEAPARSSRIVSGGAMGDAVRRVLAGRRIAVFDALGAPFWIDAAGFAQDAPQPEPTTPLSRWLAGMEGAGAAPSAFGEVGPALAVLGSPAENELEVGLGGPVGAHLGLVSRPAVARARLGNTDLSAFASTVFDGDVGAHALDADTHGVALSWSPVDDRTGLHAGLIRETDTLFGAGAQGAFGRFSSGLSFVGASGAFEAGGWRVGMAGEIGRAMPEAAGGILADAGASAFSTAFSAEAAHPLAGGTLRLSLQQPLRVESGRLHLSLPTGRTPEGVVVRKGVPVDLEPSGRQLDFGLDWTGAVASGSVLRIGARLIRAPGHVAGRRPVAAVFAGLRIRM